MKINKNKLLSSPPLHEAGESFIYKHDSDKVLKIYKPKIDLCKKEKKIDHLIKIDFPREVIKPIDKVYDMKNNFIGFTMKEIQAEEIRRLFNKRYVISNNMTKKDILGLLCKIRDVIKWLHGNNIVIGDLNDQNILIDKKNIYFIDVDSWHLPGMHCEVAMDLYKDPLLQGNNFTKETDEFAFLILVFRCLTRIHPYGGVMSPDMDLTERMVRKISVIDNKVTIPSKIDRWDFFSQSLLNDCKNVFNYGKRYFIESIREFLDNLSLCKGHGNYYYSKYSVCPVCNSNSKLRVDPQKINSTDVKISILPLFIHGDIKLIFSEGVYLDINNKVIIRNLSNKELNFNSKFYYYSCDNNYYVVFDDEIIINDKYIERCTPGTRCVVKSDGIYYIKNNYLWKNTYTENGNYSKIFNDVANNVIFNVYNEDKIFICNMYDNYKLICFKDTFYKLNTNDRIRNYGIHYDEVKDKWLFIYENNSGKFRTLVFSKHDLLYEDDKIKYSTALGNICINNGVIFIPGDKKIIGFNYKINQYKEFNIPVVSEESKIRKTGKKFKVYNEKEIWEVG